MRRLLAVIAVIALALALPAAAQAKFQLALMVDESALVVGKRARVTVTTEDATTEMRLVAVPPATEIYAALGEEERYRAELTRQSPGVWTADVRFSRPGTWLLVVPNWGAPGYAIPPPIVRRVEVAAAPASGRTVVPWAPIGTALAGAVLLLGRVGRRRALVAASLLALALPAGAAAKGPVSAQLCGPDACRDVAVTPHFEGSEPPPAPAPYYQLRLDFGNGVQSRGIYYEPRSGLVAYAEDFGAVSWAPMRLDAAGVTPFPTPRVAAAWVGDRRVSGDPSGYLTLVTLRGPWVAPQRPTDFRWLRLESPTPNPWTSQALVYYLRDRVLLTQGAVYVRVPDEIAAALEAAAPIDPAGRMVPWLPIAVALGGAVALLLLRTLGVWSGSLRPSSSSTSSGRRRWRPARTRRSSAAA